MNAFEKAVRAAMARAGMNQTETAGRIGTTTPALNRWLKSGASTLRTLDKFAAACGTSSSAILAERDELAGEA